MNESTSTPGHTADSAAARGLDHCPVCNYSLNGLPLAYRCPECGFEYDEHSLAWRTTSFRLYLLGVMPLIVLFISVPDIPNHLRTGPGDWRFYFALINAGLIAVVAHLLITNYRRGPFVAAAPRGLFLRVGFRGLRVISWNDVLSVACDFPDTFHTHQTVKVLVHGHSREHQFSARSLNVPNAERMVAEILAARERYRSQNEPN